MSLPITVKRDKFYIHILPGPGMESSQCPVLVKRVCLLADPNHGELEFNQEEDVVISIPEKAQDPIC